ncbi:glycosyltransferase [Flavihumibacter rivuli]|uniref:glycosyltransferase n=1 Tax=Flavihumibacter rivuli TaxID=2838156 RepID=UPI001BDE0624|nr:glycosyltransferase [Flavihumibacter rivuli]ULQ56472.1 glycosyltransferase [Flavihumibacter rivuli]
MNIVHVVEPFASGIAVFVRSLVETMTDDVHIIIHGERREVTPFDQVKKQFRHKNVRFIRWRSAQRSISLRKDSAAFLELYTILRRLKAKNLVDAVHLHSSKSGFIGRAACRAANIKNVIYTPNGAPFLIGTSPVSKFLYKQLEIIGNMIGGEVVCCSESEMHAYRQLGIKASFVNNGIEPENIRQLKKLDKSLMKKDKSKFRLVTSGRIIYQKNPQLFNTIASYFEEFSQFEFIWIGDGPDKDILTSKNIIITGWQPHDKVHQLVSSADIYLSTAVFEGLPFAVLEALALNKPVILSDCVGNRDLVNNGLNGDLFNTADEAIIKILQYQNNENMLTIMGKHSASICDTSFNMHQSYRQYKNLYSRPLNGIV